MSESTFTDPKVIELSKSFVNVIAHSETTHGTHDVPVGKETLKLCNEYFNIPCSVHTKGASVMGKFFQGTFGTPSTVFADPTGKEISKVTGGLSGGELIKKMNEALTKVPGEKIHLAMWQAARKCVADTESFLEKGDSKKAVDAVVRLGKMKGAGFKTMTEEATTKANEAGRKALKEALALENVEDKKKALKKIVEDYKPLEVSLEAKKELDAIK
ncbi:MAG: hypothetical protein HY293_14665 [Planctomycetes bacterium]|nr:hypothetical protein [Planctomycetota bacterium]